MSGTAGGSGSGSGGVGMLGRMVEEVDGMNVDAAAVDVQAGERDCWALVSHGTSTDKRGGEEIEMARTGKGAGDLVTLPDEEDEEANIEDKPFRLFDLPTEIRLEIYRACLTRPYKILLSKPERPAPAKAEDEQDVDSMTTTGGESTGSSWNNMGHAQVSSRRRGTSRGAARASLRTSASSSSQSQSQPGPLGLLTMTPATVTHNSRGEPNKKPISPPSSGESLADDPLIVPLLRTSKTVYKEARDVLYSENAFSLDLSTAVTSLAALHQRSRRRIRHVELEIPTYTEILESFSETVRLSLRYCFGLKRLVIRTPFTLPGADGATGSASGNTTVYANGFDILRWLPQSCEVVLEGTRNKEIDAVVGRHMQLAGVQDKVSPRFFTFLSSGAT